MGLLYFFIVKKYRSASVSSSADMSAVIRQQADMSWQKVTCNLRLCSGSSRPDAVCRRCHVSPVIILSVLFSVATNQVLLP